MVNYSYFIRHGKKLHLCVTRRSFSSIAICAKLIFSDHDKFRNAASIARSDVSLETKKKKDNSGMRLIRFDYASTGNVLLSFRLSVSFFTKSPGSAGVYSR